MLENGADVNLKTNNDETVLELCDDADVREFIVQKCREIETEQQKQAAARAAAALQMKQLQMINNANTSANNGSIKSSDKSSNNTISNNNNSGRSLKRTSTGVNRR